MASEAQMAANRRNAQASTGPRTAEGKARVAQNGLKHGLCSERVVLPGEDPEGLAALVEDLVALWRPANAMELALLREYAAATWRLGRIPGLEAGLLEAGWPEDEGPEDVHPEVWGMGQSFVARGKEIARLSLHEGRIARERERARKELAALQAARREREREQGEAERQEQEPSAELALDSQRRQPVAAASPGLAPSSFVPPRAAPAPQPTAEIRPGPDELALLSRRAA